MPLFVPLPPPPPIVLPSSAALAIAQSDFAMSRASNEMTEHAEKAGEEATYRPTEHGGLKKDGTPDKRVSSEHGFGGNKELASEAGRLGGEKGAEDFAHGGEAVPPADE
ncbi:hypothetical protein JCM10213v2_004246 [Rhodosporidiobolus nylandii]